MERHLKLCVGMNSKLDVEKGKYDIENKVGDQRKICLLHVIKKNGIYLINF